MKKLSLYLLSALAAVAGGCSDLTELNVNPTKANGSIDPSLLVPTIQMSHSMGRQNAARFFTYPGEWVNHWSGSWGNVEYGGKGIRNNGYFARLWQDLFYPEAVKNIVALENIADNDPELVNYSAIAKVLRVETFLKLTDCYGDVPYFEGGQGYYQSIFSPKYDRQEAIYNDFFERLDGALAQFDASKSSPSTDCYFGGDVEKWKRFAASLKLRVAMRLIKVKPDVAQQKAREAFAAGVMTSNADIAAVKHAEDYETLGAGNGYADIILQVTGNTGLGITQYKMTTEFFKSLCVMDPQQYTTPPYRRYLALDPRLLLIAGVYVTTSGAGLPAWGDAVEVTELMRKFNAGYAGNQGPADLAATPDGYINIGGYLTLPAQDFTYGGGNQGPGENGYQGAAKTRSVWAQGITSAMVDAATWMTEDERAELKRVIGSYTVPHAMYRLSPSRTVMAVDSPWIHMSYAETQFLLAETTVRGWGIDTETAESRFAKGYEAAVKQFSLFGVSAADMPSDEKIRDYMTTYLLPEVAAGGTRALEEINKQIWILHFMDPIEAWSNLRRTDGMPTAYCKWYNRYPSENQSNGQRPLRLTYPIEEQSKNAANWQEAVDRMGGSDDWTVPVWWDVQ